MKVLCGVMNQIKVKETPSNPNVFRGTTGNDEAH